MCQLPDIAYAMFSTACLMFLNAGRNSVNLVFSQKRKVSPTVFGL
jgi:hypothetical protein